MGRLRDKDPISSKLPFIGQMNPTIETRWRLSQGRAVAGFGSVPESYQAERRDDYVEQIEGEDDVFGSGIFDRGGREGTVHPQLGVFSDHPSLPGYIAREVQFAVSKDVKDITAGAEVVVVPGGGMAYVERGGRNVGPLETDDHMNPYVMLGGGRRALVGGVRVASPTAQGVPTAHPDGGTTLTRATPADVPMEPTKDKFSADNAQYNTAFQQNAPIGGLGVYPWRGPVRAYGADPPAPSTSWGSYLAAGAIVGVAAAIFMGTVKMPGRRRAAR